MQVVNKSWYKLDDKIWRNIVVYKWDPVLCLKSLSMSQ